MSLQEYFNYNINFNTSNSLTLGQTTVGSIFTPGSGMLTHTVNTIGNMFMTGGNIGIGTTAPIFQLQVATNSDATLAMGLSNDHTGGNSRVTFNMLLGVTSSGHAGQIYASISDPTFTIRSYSANTSGISLITGGTAPIKFSTQSIERMRITNAGNIGIGTIAPSYTLDVSGTGRFTGNLMATSTSNTLGPLITTFGNVGIGITPSYTLDVSGSGRFSNNLLATFNSNTIGSIITTGGNVGIGTIAPSYTLDVSGSGRFSNNLLATFNSNTIGSIITTGGNVGIGITPAAPLDVKGASSWGIVRLSPSSIGGESSIAFFPNNFDPQSGSTNANWAIGTNLFGGGTNNFNIYRNGITTAFTINSSGNTGIGTATPLGRLHLSSGTTVGNIIIDNLSGANDGFSYIGFNGYNTSAGIETRINTNKLRWRVSNDQRTTNDYFMIDAHNGTSFPYSVLFQVGTQGNIKLNTGGEARYHLYNGAGVSEWIFGQKSSTRSDFTFSKLVSGTEFDYLTINTSGSIGISNTSPAYTLDVNGSSNTIQATGTNNTLYVPNCVFANNSTVGGTAVASFLTPNMPANTWSQCAYFGKSLNVGNSVSIGYNYVGNNNAANFISIGHYGLGGGMYMLNNGNVGIGTQTPTELLHMTGGSISISTDNATSRGILFNQNAVWGGIDLEGIGNIPGSQILNIGINTNRSKTWNSSYVGGYFRIDSRGGTGIPLFQWYKKDATGGTETMMACLSSTGNFGIGISTPSTKLHVSSSSGVGLGVETITSSTSMYLYNNSSTTPYGLNIYYNGVSNGGGERYFWCNDNNRLNFSVAGNGNVQNANNSYGGTSDIKLKENIIAATSKLNDIMKVKIRTYNFKGDTIKQIGVIAQELETIFPSLIEDNKDIDKDGNDLGTTTKSVKYSVFVPILIKALQETIIELESTKINLENRLQAAENTIEKLTSFIKTQFSIDITTYN